MSLDVSANELETDLVYITVEDNTLKIKCPGKVIYSPQAKKTIFKLMDIANVDIIENNPELPKNYLK